MKWVRTRLEAGGDKSKCNCHTLQKCIGDDIIELKGLE